MLVNTALYSRGQEHATKATESRFAVFDPRVALQNITATDSTLYCSAVKRLGLYHRHFGAPVPVFKRFGG